jgi:hypothetical protein
MNNLSEEEKELLEKIEEERKIIIREKVKLEKQELATRIEGLVFLKNEIAKQNVRHAIIEKIEKLINQMIDDPETRLDLPTLLRIHESFTRSENEAALGIFSVLKQQIMVQQNNIIAQGSKDIPRVVITSNSNVSEEKQQKKKETLITAKNFIELVDELEQTEFSSEERLKDSEILKEDSNVIETVSKDKE